jgi:hypothetical protein
VLAVFGVWLLTLSVLFAAVVRHLGTMQATMVGIARGMPFDFAADGPDLMSEVPGPVRETLAGYGIAGDANLVVLFVSTSCDPCLERVEEFSRSPAGAGARLVVLAAGRDPDRVARFRDLLGPSSAAFVTDPAAHETVTALHIQSTPFALRMSNGRIVEKTYVSSAADVEALLKHVPARPSPTDATTEERSNA